MQATETVAGVILCGGNSRRMGRDKGLILENGVPWALHVYQKLSHLVSPVVLSINATQQESYRPFFSKEVLITDTAYADVNGPVKGLLSVFRWYRKHHFLVVPCDMPRLDEKTFQLLLSSFEDVYPSSHGVVAKTDTRLQPLCGIYGRNALTILETQYGQGALQNKSMYALLHEYLSLYAVEIPKELENQFRNFNASSDLR